MIMYPDAGRCHRCGGEKSFVTMEIEHGPECPHHPDRAKARVIGVDLASGPEVAGSIGSGARVASMDLARFKRAEKPAGLSPRGALEAAMEWIDDPETDAPTHIIVLVGRDAPDGGSMTRYFQAGAYRHHGQMGLCLEAMHMIRESGS